MSLASGSRVGVYEVLGAIGAGGMGEVYRARDTKLQRDVALKVLPDSFASDPERLARFQREAQVLALLNHPNIAAIHGLEEADGVRALVLELVEGPTLAEVIAGHGLALADALPIARQIAEALEAAHEHGIIHRDLKPANINVRADGTVKVLDFGLAKALGPVTRPSGEGWGEGEDAANSPTLSLGATQAGVILGTAAYMSPEQAKGKPVDKRADIWAFGCVLYEMLTGRRAFEGEDVSDTLARILMKEPEWAPLPADAPPALRRLLRRCLAKDRRQRLSDAAAVRLEIEEAMTSPASEAAPPLLAPSARTPRRTVALAVTAALITASLVTGAAVWLATRPAPPRVARWTLTTEGNPITLSGIDRDLAISRDGMHLAYVSGNRIFVRRVDQLHGVALDGLGGPQGLFFSPDGRWVGYFDGLSTIKTVATSGGPALTIGRILGGPRGGSWSPDGTIVFATNDTTSGLLRVAAAGGEPEVLTTPNRDLGEQDHLWPEVLPGGEAVLFTILSGGTADTAQIAVLDLRTREQKVLVRSGSHAHYVPTGHLVYGAAGTLFAIAFDLGRLEALGTPVPVIEQIMTAPSGGLNASASHDGTLVYVPGGAQAATRTLVWVDRQGRETSVNAPPRAYVEPRVSPDGTRVALRALDQEQDIWIWDLTGETLTRFTFDPAQDLSPTWTPDGQRLVFRSSRGGPVNIFWQAANGTGSVERLIESPNNQTPYAFSPDGTRLVIREDLSATGQDLALVVLDGERRTQPLVQTTFNELNAEVSPDGRWLAYQSNESGQDEIYVRPFPDVNAGRWQLSSGGGRQPLWERNGRELFFVGPAGTVISVAVDARAGSTTFRAGNPVTVVQGRYIVGAVSRAYDVSPDGERFLMIKQGGSDEASAPRIIVVQNWHEELKRLVPRN